MDPFALFADWYAQARAAEPSDSNAMALATATPDGRPSVRMVLLKAWDRDGFVFYTNTQSRKGDELAANPHVALCFHWKSTYKQVRIEGSVTPVTTAEADAYFESRGRAKQIAAIASDQSRPLDARETYEARMEQVADAYPEGLLPRPAHWSGYRVAPTRIEFWEGTPERMHHRQLFIADGNGGWSETLLYP